MDILTQNYLTRGFWGDEAWTALISQFPLKEILRITGEDFHPPAYYFLVHGFIKLFGASEWIRLISIIFFLLTPWLVYFLAKKLVDRKFGFLAAGVVAMSPILFTYAFEARAYAMVAFISALTALMFWQAITTRRWGWWLAYWLAGSVGVYTHYYMWFILAGQGFYWLMIDRKQFWRVLAVYGGILLTQLPWLPVLLSQVGSVAADYWIAPIDKRTHGEFFLRVAGGDYPMPQQMVAAGGILMLLGLSLITVRWREKKYPEGYIFLWMWLGIPILIPTLLSLYRPVFFYRYLIFSAIPILIISLWGLYAVKKWLAYGGGAFLAAVYLWINVLGFQRYPYTMREEIDKVIAEKPAKIVTVLPAFAEVMYYTRGRAEVQVLPVGIVQFSGKSLLDAFVRMERVKIEEPGEAESYWLIEPGPKSEYVAK